MPLNKKVIITVFIALCLLIIKDSFLPLSIQESIPRISHDLLSDARKLNQPPRAEYEYLRLRNPETGKIPRGITGKQLNFAKTIPTIEALRMNKLAKGERVTNYGWKNRGPYNFGGRTRSFGLDIRDENIMLAGGVTGGMWKSFDHGQNWIKTTKPDQLHNISCLVQDTRHDKEDTWYCGTGEISGGDDTKGILRGDGIYKTYDNGDTWQLIVSTSTDKPEETNIPFDYVTTLAVDLSNTDEDEIYAAAYGAILRSIDGGVNWDIVLGGPGRAISWSDVALTSDGIVYAALSYGIDRGLWRSEDGINWTNITPDTWPQIFYRITVEIAPSNENAVYFFTETTENWEDWLDHPTFCLMKYEYISGAGSGAGGTWEDRSTVYGIYTILGYCMSLDIYPEDEDIVFIGGQNLYRSMDGFSTRYNTRKIGDIYDTFYYDEGYHCDMHDIVFSRIDPKVAYIVNDGGIARTADITELNVTWNYLNNGYRTTQFYYVAIEPDISGDKSIIGGIHDNGVQFVTSDQPDAPWDFLYDGDGAYTAFLENGTKYLTSWQNGNTLIGTGIPEGPGEEHTHFTRINPDFRYETVFINPFVLDPNDESVLYMAGGLDLWRNSNISAIPLDNTYTTKSINWSIISTEFATISAIGVSKTPSNVVYYGTTAGQLYKITNADKTNPEKDRIYRNKGFPSSAYVSCIAVDPHDADHVVISFSNYEVKSIFSTRDGGETWTDVSGNLEEQSNGRGSGPSVKWIAILPEAGSNTYFAGTSTGLYSTTDLNGLNTVWAQEGAETIGNVDVSMITTREIDGEVVIATFGNGVYSRDFTTGVEDNDPVQIPAGFDLSQNYPNPFNPSTTIGFRLLSPSEVSLKIYNITGQLIKTLISTQMPAGLHDVKWDGTNFSGNKVSSGTYIYTLKAGNHISSKRMILIK